MLVGSCASAGQTWTSGVFLSPRTPFWRQDVVDPGLINLDRLLNSELQGPSCLTAPSSYHWLQLHAATPILNLDARDVHPHSFCLPTPIQFL